MLIPALLTSYKLESEPAKLLLLATPTTQHQIVALLMAAMPAQLKTITNPLAADTTIWSAWSDWTPTENANTSIISIVQTRVRTCEVTTIGNTDNPAPNCSAIDGGNASATKTIANPLAADTAIWSAWSDWTPTTASSNIQQLTQNRTRTCVVTPIGNTDNPAPNCSGSTTDNRNIINPDYDANNTDALDTAAWSGWSQWSPASNTDTSILEIMQSRTRTCEIKVNDTADSPAPNCSAIDGGNTSETQTIENPLAADTATWSAWSQWTPAATSTDTSVIDIVQTRSRNCIVTTIGNSDSPAPNCSGSTSTIETETQTVTNPQAADTATWSNWSQWSPANNTDTSVITITQTRTRTCEVIENGDPDDPAANCSAIDGGNTSATKMITNPLAADTAVWSAWSLWSPTSTADTSLINIAQTRTRTCQVTVIGNTDSPAPNCSGSTSTIETATQTISNPNFIAGFAANGVTIVCDALTVGASFSVSGTTYTKRAETTSFPM